MRNKMLKALGIIAAAAFVIGIAWLIIFYRPNAPGNTIMGRFEIVEDLDGDGLIAKDKETDVLYLIRGNGMTVLLDADGKPLLDKGAEHHGD